MAQRDVVVNGVTVPMWTQDEEPYIRPMKMAVGLLRTDPSASFGGAPLEKAIEAIERLEEAGVKWLPLVEDEAREAGIEWAEVHVS